MGTNDRDESGRQQHEVYVVERDRLHRICHTFAEIQASGNPLTSEEIERLSRLRPQYAILSRRSLPSGST